MPLAVVLALILIGVVQGREDRDATLRWEVWQLVGALVVVLCAALAPLVGLGIALALALGLLVRSRRGQEEADDLF